MKCMRSKFVTSASLVSVFILSVAGSTAFAADGAGGVLQQLEKTDKMYRFKEKSPPVIELEKEKPVMEKPQTGKKIFVKKFRLEGNTLISEKDLLAGVFLGEGKALTLDEIISVADLVTARYRDKGFLIVNAYVPSQRIFDGAVLSKKYGGYSSVNAFGTVTIRVIEGKVGTISVTGNNYYRSSFIEGFLEKVRHDPSLKEETLVRELLILNEYPLLSVKTTLKAGKEFGTTDIIATVSDKYPLFGTVSYDNFGVKSTSRNRLSAALNVGNALTSGDLVKLNGILGLDDIADPGRLAYGRVEYLVPVGGTGAQIGAYYSNTVYAVGGADSLAAVGLNGKAQVVGIYATHPMVKRLDTSLNLKFGGESISLHDDLLNRTQDKDEVRKLIAGISYESTDRFLGRNFISFGYARGLGGFLGGTKNGAINPGPSYAGADNMFNKFNLDAMRVQKLPGYNHLIARGNVQYSPDRLFSAERVQVGGEGSVRGVTPATISGDSGYFTSLELVVSPFFPEKLIFNQKIGDTIQFALFTDCGWATNTSPRPSEINSSSVSSVGAGLRLYGDNRYIFKLDWALPSTHGSYKSINVNESQVYVQAAVSF